MARRWTIKGDRICERRFWSKRSAGIHDINAISGICIDKITYDENFLILHLDNGRVLEIGELDDGFADVTRALAGQLKRFPVDWMAHITEKDSPKTIWTRC